MTEEPLFSWVPFYEELADSLLQSTRRQPELVQFREGLRDQGQVVAPLRDDAGSGMKVPLAEIDPFTLFAIFNRTPLSDANRREFAMALARKLGVRAPPPINFDGIPNVSNQVTWFFRYAHSRKPTDITTLWTLFERALDPAALESTVFAEAFDAALEATIIPSNLTIGLFWIRPNVFASLDGKVQKYLGINIEPKQLTANRYVAEVQHIAQGGISFPRLSYDAWRASRMPSSETVAVTRKKVAGAYKDWLKEAYETQLSEMGSKKTREHLPAIAPNGAWADAGIQSKPLAWIVEFSKDANGAWVAGLPPSNYPKRIGGSFKSKSPPQGGLRPILPVVSTVDS